MLRVAGRSRGRKEKDFILTKYKNFYYREVKFYRMVIGGRAILLVNIVWILICDKEK